MEESNEKTHNLKLAFTKIGRLLIDNEISNTANNQKISDISLRIPNYQRPYKWNSQNSSQLFDDIEDAFKSEKEIYRVGTLILHKDNTNHDNINTYDIVDGQQRTITFFILLQCFFELLGTKSQGQKISNQFNAFNKNLENLKLNNNQYNIENVIKNYNTFQRRLNRYDTQNGELNELFEYIKENCEFVVVITTDLSEAFQFFDSQNARGKALYPHDLLKAYHLREMNNYEVSEIEKAVQIWENLDQKNLSRIFQDYLYRLKEWMNGNKCDELNEKNLYLFKGITAKDVYPYAQFYKSAYSYANDVNNSSLPFVAGIQKIVPFQLNTPIVAGKPFFEYTKHYFDIWLDVLDNSKYEGYFIKDNPIIKTLDLKHNKTGTGNEITRLLLDTAILLYVDRFCPPVPSQHDTLMLDQFVKLAFIWAYSMRAQYKKVGWPVAQNYIMGFADVKNSFNIYKVINDSESPGVLLSRLQVKLSRLDFEEIKKELPSAQSAELDKTENKDPCIFLETIENEGIRKYFLYYFHLYQFLENLNNGSK